MPRKPKFTKEEIVAAALALVSEKGTEALTARELGLRLGSSARPIFTVFQSMEEVQRQLRQAAMERFDSFAEKAMHYTPPFPPTLDESTSFTGEARWFARELQVRRGIDSVDQELVPRIDGDRLLHLRMECL